MDTHLASPHVDDAPLEAVLPRLAHAHQRGLLVPFIGAGMSRPAAVGWEDFVARIEGAAEVTPASEGIAPSPDAPALIWRASRAQRAIRFTAGRPELEDRVRRALYSVDSTSPAQTRSLARTDWPLVLTTNYDDYLYRALQRRDSRDRVLEKRDSEHPVRVLGRTAADCHQVLGSLATPSPTIIWALQGFLPRETDLPPHHARLASELVIGHEEYRRVTHAESHFRRAFAEVFRRRSFLFLGAGLREPYFLELFDEVLEFHGPNPHPHYAFVPQGERLDAEFLRRRYNILLVEYPPLGANAHGIVPHWLDRLHERITRSPESPLRWSYTVHGNAVDHEVTIEATSLPTALGSSAGKQRGSECVVLSAGWAGHGIPYLSTDKGPPGSKQSGLSAERTVERILGLEPTERPTYRRVTNEHAHAFEFHRRGYDGRSDVLGVIPWTEPSVAHRDGERDVRLIPPCMRAAFDWVGERDTVHFSLLAAGASRHFHRAYALAAMLRPIGEWLRGRDRRTRVTIHVRDVEVLREVSMARLDPLEILSTPDVRFWLEIVDAEGRTDRHLTVAPLTWTVHDVLMHEVAPTAKLQQWRLTVEPSPTPSAEEREATNDAGTPLSLLGVLPGGTLRLRHTRAGT